MQSTHVRVRVTRGALLLSGLLLATPAAEAGRANGGISKATAASSKDKDQGKKEQARKLYEEGMIRYDLRKYEEAITQFEEAYKVSPNPALLYNIAQAHRMAGHNAEAIGFYQNYLRRMPEPSNLAEVQQWIAQLQAAGPGTSEPKAPPLPPPAPYLEPRSKHNFLTRITHNGTGYVLTGVSFRSYLGFTVYGVGMYVQEEPARRAFPKLVQQAGGTELTQLRARDLAQNFVVLGEFGKLARMYFVRDVAAVKVRDAYRELLKDNLKSSVAPQLRQQTEQFLALFDRDMKTGEELLVMSDKSGLISVAVGDVKKDGPQSPTLAIDLWNLWLGPKPLTPELKQGLVERIATLGEVGSAAGAAAGAKSTTEAGKK